MRNFLVITAFLTSGVAAKPAAPNPFLGTFTNEEQVYFDKEAGQTPPPWFSMKITPRPDGLMIDEIDAFGKPHSTGHALKLSREGAVTVLDYGNCQRLYVSKGTALVASGNRGKCSAPATITQAGPEGLTLTFPNGKTSLLRRARDVTCWAAVPKTIKKPDGSPDWYFMQNVKMHDQGGRAMIGGEASGADPVVIRMRSVTWPAGSTNRPSTVLYVHKPDNPDHAESYAWADPGAARIGINLRWMQASCTVDGAEAPSKITTKTFRG